MTTVELDRDTGKIVVDSEFRWKEMLKSIPGASWDRALNKWTIPVSWSACLALRSTFGAELTIGPELLDWSTTEHRERVGPCLALRDQIDAHGDPLLFGWQRSGVEFIRHGRQVLISDSMGAGKTATAIRGVAALSADGEDVFPILVVAPNSVKESWKREFEHWWPGITVSVIKGSAAQRKKAMSTAAHVYVINYESLRSHSRLAPYGSIGMKKCLEHGGEDPKVTERTCQVHPKELNSFSFNTVIADEVHRAKDPKSQQTRALFAAAGDAEFRIGLTGTPIANDVVDLWSILHFLKPDEWPTKTRWVDRYVETMLNAFGALEVFGIKAEMQNEFYAALNSRFRRMPEELILAHLPPYVFERRDCEMGAKQAKAYKQMRDEMVSDLESGLLTAPNPLTQTTRLLQLASSYATVEPVETTDEHGFPKMKYNVTLEDPSCKVDAFMESIEDFGTESVAVMAVSRQLIELLSARLEKKKIPHGLITGAQSSDERQQHMDDFQAGKTQFILFTAAAGGTGVTLTAARYLARLQLPYSLVDYKQSMARVRRIGSEKHENIIIIDYVTEGTIDPKVHEALVVKETSFEEVVRDQETLLRLLGEK